MSDHVPCLKRERRLWLAIALLVVSHLITCSYLWDRLYVAREQAECWRKTVIQVCGPVPAITTLPPNLSLGH